jgi:hypothetical protein
MYTQQMYEWNENTNTRALGVTDGTATTNKCTLTASELKPGDTAAHVGGE